MPATVPGLLCPACALRGALAAGNGPPVPGAGGHPSVVRPGSRSGDYELVAELARGGMGVVYRARQISLNRIVAVKLIRPERLARPDDVRRFQFEAMAAAQLRHPNIVSVHEAGEWEGQPYFSMEFVAGRSLAEVVREQALSPFKAATLVKAVAEAIHYAHAHGILHRDLKPSNILIDTEGRPRVTDFGLAKVLADESAITLTGEVLGSPSYMAPEQAGGRSHQVDARTDVYALGAILYELLGGRAPFRAETSLATLKLVLETAPVAPRLLNPRLPRDLETICLQCLEKDPARRYPSAQGLADDLGRFLVYQPIRARPVRPPEKLWRWCQRKPVVAALGAGLVLALGLGLAGVTWQWRRAESERRLQRWNLYASDMKAAQVALKENNRGLEPDPGVAGH